MEVRDMHTFRIKVGEMQVRHLTYEVKAPTPIDAEGYVQGDDSMEWVREDSPDPKLIDEEHVSTISVDVLAVEKIDG
jgi:hypothetical protein